MKKKCIVINDSNGKPIVVAGLKEIEPRDFSELAKEAANNYVNKVILFNDKFNQLQKQIDDLKAEIKILKGED